MKNKPQRLPHKLAPHEKEAPVAPPTHDPNFKQSRDLREDRGERQIKLGSAPRSTHE